MHAAGSTTEAALAGKYEILRPLAVGGMAEVFLARARASERLLVIKRLRAQLAVEPDFVQMFLAEGRLALTLRHPNVVEVFEVGEAGEGSGQFYIAMEYLHGHDLRETMQQLIERHATVRLDQALSVAHAVASGLHYTHEQLGPDGEPLDIVHRDVSPHNVLLTFDGRVKLVDFGIAKTSSPQNHTRTGVLKGKAAYMAPEQAMGLALDRRSDVFCLGILMWEMTTGQRLYRRRTELATLNAVADERPPRPSRIVPGYPRDLENLIMKTLAHEREERWATAGELLDAIDELARRRKVTLGLEPVRSLTASAFAEELAAWRAVQAFGISLGDHLVARNDRETTRPNDNDDNAEQLPMPMFEMTRQERPSRPRRWWPVAAVVAAATLAATATAGWFVLHGDHEAASSAPVSPPAAATTSSGGAPAAGSASSSIVPNAVGSASSTAAGSGASTATAAGSASTLVAPLESAATVGGGSGTAGASAGSAGAAPSAATDNATPPEPTERSTDSASPPRSTPSRPTDSVAPTRSTESGTPSAAPADHAKKLSPRPPVKPRPATPERKPAAPPIPSPGERPIKPPRPSPADLDKLP